MEQIQNNIAPEAATDEPASPANPAPAATGIAFDPVPVRERIDGIGPEKQREFVEALADTGLVHVAAERIGVTEQSIARLRRRADARSFDLACAAARRIGARRLHAVAWQRAIEGTVRRHYYHGELVSEERVYDNKLLVYLLGRTEHLLDEPEEEAQAVVRDWEPFVEAMEAGLPPPGTEEPAAPEAEAEAEKAVEEWDGTEVWDRDGDWWTDFPPPAGFDGHEEGRPGSHGYKRTLSEAEEAVIDAELRDERAGAAAAQCARRDRYFGFPGGIPDAFAKEGSFCFPMEAEPSEPSAESGVRGTAEE